MNWIDLADDDRRRFAIARLAEFRQMDAGRPLTDGERSATECDEAAGFAVWIALRNTGINEQHRDADLTAVGVPLDRSPESWLEPTIQAALVAEGVDPAKKGFRAAQRELGADVRQKLRVLWRRLRFNPETPPDPRKLGKRRRGRFMPLAVLRAVLRDELGDTFTAKAMKQLDRIAADADPSGRCASYPLFPKLIAPWVPPAGSDVSPVIKVLARGTWRNRTLQRVIAEQKRAAQGVQPTLPNTNLLSIVKASNRRNRSEDEGDQERAPIRDKKAEPVPGIWMNLVKLNMLSNAAFKILGSLNANKLFRSHFHELSRRIAAESPEPWALAYRTRRECAEVACFADLANCAEEVDRILWAQSALWVRIITPNGYSEGPLLNPRLYYAHDGEPYHVRIDLPREFDFRDWRPGAQRKWSRSKRIQALPIPITGPDRIAPLHPKRRDIHGPQAQLQLLWNREFMLRAREYEKTGAITVAEDRRLELAAEAGFPTDNRRNPLAVAEAESLQAWIGESSAKGPAYLRRVDRDRFALAEAYQPEADCVLRWARISGTRPLPRGRKGKRRGSR